MAVLELKISTKRDTSTLIQAFETAGGKQQIGNRMVNFVQSVISGTELAMSSSIPPQIAITIQENKTQATGSFTFSNTATANDTVLVNGVTFTYVASGATGNQVNRGASATDSAANLATVINASASALITAYVTAAAALGVCTITSSFYGTSGNQVTIAEGVDAGSVILASGARLTAGTNDATAQTLQF